MSVTRQLRTRSAPALDWLRASWAGLGPREQRGLRLAAGVLGAALLWWLVLAPPLRTLRGAAAQHAQLSATLERMQVLQARAQRLRDQPAVTALDMQRALQSATATLGKEASLQVAGEQATVSVQGVRGATLAAWLASMADQGLSPSAARLQRDADAAQAQWSGTLVFRLPPQPAEPVRRRSSNATP